MSVGSSRHVDSRDSQSTVLRRRLLDTCIFLLAHAEQVDVSQDKYTRTRTQNRSYGNSKPFVHEFKYEWF